MEWAETLRAEELGHAVWAITFATPGKRFSYLDAVLDDDVATACGLELVAGERHRGATGAPRYLSVKQQVRASFFYHFQDHERLRHAASAAPAASSFFHQHVTGEVCAVAAEEDQFRPARRRNERRQRRL